MQELVGEGLLHRGPRALAPPDEDPRPVVVAEAGAPLAPPADRVLPVDDAPRPAADFEAAGDAETVIAAETSPIIFHHAAIATAFHVPGEPPATQTHSKVPPAVGPVFHTRSRVCHVPETGAAEP
jgi:hypothetical protein